MEQVGLFQISVGFPTCLGLRVGIQTLGQIEGFGLNSGALGLRPIVRLYSRLMVV